jgi:hypothetical protein
MRTTFTVVMDWIVLLLHIAGYTNAKRYAVPFDANRGRPGAPFAVVASGRFTCAGSVHEGCPSAEAIGSEGYNAFVHSCRAGFGVAVGLAGAATTFESSDFGSVFPRRHRGSGRAWLASGSKALDRADSGYHETRPSGGNLGAVNLEFTTGELREFHAVVSQIGIQGARLDPAAMKMVGR